MSLPFNGDNSIQSNFTFNTGNSYDGVTTSNYVITTSNNLQTNINLKQDILSFTAPLTKSTNTISIDLSSYYNKTSTDTLLNAKQNNLSFTNF